MKNTETPQLAKQNVTSIAIWIFLFLAVFTPKSLIGQCDLVVDCSNIFDQQLECRSDLPPVDFNLPIVIDSCGDVILSALTIIPGNSACPDDTLFVTRTYFLQDTDGNMEECGQTFTIVDDVAPMMICQPFTVELDASGMASITVADIDGGSTANCGSGIAFSLSQSNFTCADVGEVDVWLIGEDDCGNIDSCQTVVTVEDNIDPVITCPTDILMDADPDRCTAVVCFDIEVTDNCEAVLPTELMGFEFLGTFDDHNYFVSEPMNTLGWEEANAAAAAVGGHLVVITSDEEQQFLIDNLDLGAYRIGLRYSPSLGEFKWVNGEPFMFEAWGPGQPGGILEGDYVYNLDFFGSFLDGWYDAPSLVDLRYIVEIETYQTELISGFPAGSNFPVGTTEVTYVGIDASGNTAMCSFNVIVEDNQAPVIDCPLDSIIQLGPEQCDTVVTFDPQFTDNCEATISQISGLPSGSSFPIGESIVSFEAVDTSGNADTCTWSIIVEEYIPQGLPCKGVINFSLDDQTCSGELTPSMLIDVTSVGCADSCVISIVEPDGSRRPAIFDSDDIGESFDYEICCGGICCWGIVNVEFKHDPVIICVPNDTLSCTQSFDESTLTPDVSMSCADVELVLIDQIIEPFTCDSMFTSKMTRIWTAIDEYGNTSDTCTQMTFLRRTNLDNIIPVLPFALYNDNAINCSSGFETTSQGYPFPALSVTGAPILRLDGEEITTPFVGSLDDTDPQWTRPFVTGGVCNPSAVGVGIPYDTYPFVLDMGANVGAEVVTFTAPSGDSFLALYENSFDPNAPCDNLLITNDDGGVDLLSQFDIMLEDGIDYILVVTTFNNNGNDYGDYVVEITSDATLLEGYEYIDLYPFDAMQICNGFAEFTDEILPGSTSCVTKILRTFTIGEWWCSQTNDREFVQLIEVVDFDGPTITCPSDFTISTASFDCEGYTEIALPSVSDACNDDIRIDLSSPSGFIKDYAGQTIMLPVGVHTLEYHSYDACDNRSDCRFTVTVRDDSDPIAICDQFTAVGIGLEELTKVTAESIDDGSFDECGPVELAVARMDSPGFDELLGFGEYVDITCADIGTTVMVGLLVTDAGGNTNMCMVSIDVQDKIDAQMLCPGDMEVECNFPFDPDNLGSFFGEVEVYDNCPATNTVEERLVGELSSCGSGVLFREISLLNGVGELVDFCVQEIVFRDGDPLQYSDITPPIAERVVTGCGPESIDPSILGMPIVPDDECQQVGIAMENDTFPFTENGACLKIIRTFKVIDWCISDGPGSVLEPFEFTQIIKVNNTEGPELEELFADTVFCSYEVDCGGIFISDYLTARFTDDCTPEEELVNRYEVRDGDGSLVRSGAGLDASGFYEVGEYTVRFISEDKCGNQTAPIEEDFEVRSCKLPTPYCLQGLSTTLVAMDTTGDGQADAEMVMLTPSFFDAGSYHPCGYGVSLSFSSNEDDTLRTFFCSDTVGLQEIELWVTDDNGGQDYCITFLDVQDNDTIDLCGGLRPVDIAGRVYTETDAELAEVAIELRSIETLTAMTDEDGLYEFADMPQGGNYKVKPIKDNDHMNGVSTLDLVLIQRHILGLSPLESVYKRIAADINNDKKISSSDLLALRKMILGIDDSFPNNTSWRFVDSGFEFEDEENPWAGEIAEDYTIAGLNDDMQVNFMAVKTGDVNDNVDINGLTDSEIETRNARTFSLVLPNIEVEKGETYEIEVSSKEEVDFYGMQFSLELVNLDIIDVQKGMLDVSVHNSARKFDQWHMSYAKGTGIIVNPGALYTLVIKATEDGVLSEMIGLSKKGLSSEYYTEQGSSTGELTIEWRDGGDDNHPVSTLSLEGNNPNPWQNNTEIVFQLPRSGNVQLIVTDINGRLLVNETRLFSAGDNYFPLTNDEIQISGMLLYEIRFEDQTQKGKMIKIE